MLVNPDRILLVCAATVVLVTGLLIFTPTVSHGSAIAGLTKSAIGTLDHAAAPLPARP